MCHVRTFGGAHYVMIDARYELQSSLFGSERERFAEKERLFKLGRPPSVSLALADGPIFRPRPTALLQVDDSVARLHN
ncbi:Hypothetical protein NTJ_15094 [Nesidiocoris tenuis]|uniref:Uncharacterized protein n=1 Tax=Nesidiocoris tenuis TaxID=355587 RepID=A0ABN7BD19_9HEMI|nr:Hypothetical protein NTJ_15094 [Nesidiocoris tenuis]